MIEHGALTVDLPKIDYICQKNTFTGSCGAFRYRLYPEEAGEAKVVTAAVYADHCYEIEDAAGRVTRESFEYTNDGIAKAEEWIAAQYDAYCAKA